MAKLVLQVGTGAGREYPLGDRAILFGRQADSEVHLDAPEVSRHHARLTCEKGKYLLEDLGSSNGTYLNKTRLSSKVSVRAGDQIAIGPFVFLVEGAPDSTVVTAPHADDMLSDEAGVIIHAEVPAHTSNMSLFRQDPARKLQAVLEISQQLANSLDLNVILPRLLDQLLRLFLQADRAFILIREGDHLVLRALRARKDQPEGPIYSRSVVRRVLDEAIGIVASDARTDQRFVATETLMALGIRSFICVPFKTHDGRPLGVLQVDRFGIGAPFTEDDLHLVTAIALQASVVLENAALHIDLLRQERMKRDLALAREIQEGFLPIPPSEGSEKGIDLFAKVYPARDVSGDFYDFFALDEQRLGFTVADVSGKGMPAALFMIAVRTLGRHLALTGVNPAAMLQKLNDSLAADNPSGMFVTMTFGSFQPSSGEVVLSSGGHPPALLRRQDGQTEEVPLPPGRVLGFSRGPLPLAETRLTLSPGETLVLYTDGITEALAPDGKTMFGNERLASTISHLPARQPLDAWTNELKAAVDHFTGAVELYDDITLLLLRRP